MRLPNLIGKLQEDETMSIHKLSMTMISAAALAACVSPTNYANLDDDRHILCTREAPTGSRIKSGTCEYTGDIASDRELRGVRHRGRYGDPFQHNPARGGGTSQPSPGSEGNCGGQISD